MKKEFLIITYICIIISYIILSFFLPSSPTPSYVCAMLIVNVLGVILFISKKEYNLNLRGQYIRTSFLFILGYLIVYFQYLFDYLFGYITESSPMWHYNRVILLSTVYSSIGLFCYFVGYLIYEDSRQQSSEPLLFNKQQNTQLLLILCVLSLILYLLNVNPLYLSGYYGEEALGDSAARYALLFKVFSFCVIILKCWNHKIEPQKNIKTIKDYLFFLGIPLITAIAIYLITVILSGDRGPLISYLLLFILVYLIATGEKISLIKLIISILVGASLITLLGNARKQSRDLDFSEKILLAISDNSQDKKSISPYTKELSSSAETLNAAVQYVENGNDYMYGRFQVQQILITVPFSYNIVNSVLFKENQESRKTLNTAEFITWIIQGNTPTYGNGTSIIADLYLDFGVITIAFGMLFFGYLSRKMELALYDTSSSFILFVFSVVYFTGSIYICRTSLLFDLQIIGWILITIYVNFIISKMFPYGRKK